MGTAQRLAFQFTTERQGKWVAVAMLTYTNPLTSLFYAVRELMGAMAGLRVIEIKPEPMAIYFLELIMPRRFRL